MGTGFCVYKDPTLLMWQGDAGDLSFLDNESVHCVVTSPPYWGLRDYGLPPVIWGGKIDCEHEWTTIVKPSSSGGKNNAQLEGGTTTQYSSATHEKHESEFCMHCNAWCGTLGLEPRPELYVEHLVEIFREVWRVLRADGQLWLNLGDSYAANRSYQVTDTKHIDVGNNMSSSIPAGLKPKDLVGIPWRVAFALQADGWYLRSDIIWAKPNPMPESVQDRPTKAHEYMFLLTKSGTAKFWTHSRKRGTRSSPDADYVWRHKQTGLVVDYQPVPERLLKKFWTKVNLWKGHDYFYDVDAVKEAGSANSHGGKPIEGGQKQMQLKQQVGGVMGIPAGAVGRNKRSVWTIATQPYKEAHFAVFPQALVEPCIMAGTSEKGVCKGCGAPYARITGRNTAPRQVDDSKLDRYGTGKAGVHRKVGGQYQKWLDDNPMQTVGWQPTCQCDSGPPIPATILDIFSGAGTTALVSRKLGRRAVYIDASLPYCGLALDRLMKDK